MTVPHDDLLDVMEMTQKIESQIGYILKDVETSLAMSALMSATINCLLDNAKLSMISCFTEISLLRYLITLFAR